MKRRKRRKKKPAKFDQKKAQVRSGWSTVMLQSASLQRLGEEGLGQRHPVRLPSALRGEASSSGGDQSGPPREAGLQGARDANPNPREGGIRGATGTGGGDRAPNPREGERSSAQGSSADSRSQSASASSSQSAEPTLSSNGRRQSNGLGRDQKR